MHVFVAPSVWKVPQLYSPKGEFYCFAVIFGFRQVIVSFGQFMGEYNITKAARLSYNLTAGQISLQTFSLQYHFTYREWYSLFFGEHLPFSKYVTYYNTFTN